MAIIGDGFDSWVQKQVKVRQTALGAFDDRSLKSHKAFQTRTPWVRLVSSVDIDGGDGTLPGKSVRKVLLDMGFPMDKLDGDQLAKNLILFSGVTNKSGKRYYGAGGPDSFFGSSNEFWAGTNERGPVPMPGITGANFSYKNDGALAQGEVSIKCFNRAQFQLLDVLYQRPGYTCLLEFGWSVYLNNSGNVVHRKSFATKPFNEMFNGSSDMFQLSEAITTEKKDWNGNYDGFFAKITKFNWKFNPDDGSYDITVNLIGLGDVIQSFKTNLAPSPAQVELANEGDWDDDDRSKANNEGMIIAADAITTVLNNHLFNIFNSRFWNNPNKLKEQTGPFKVVVQSVPYKSGKTWKTKNITYPKGGYQVVGAETDAHKWYKPSTYITLNVLLALLASNCNMHNPSDGAPIIQYDMDFENPDSDKNRMTTFPGMYSGNPTKILFPYKPVSASITTKVKMPNGVVNKALEKNGPKFYVNTAGTLAILGNVLIDTNHIAVILKENKDEDDNILLLDFLNAVLQSINNTSGGINDFRVIHDVSTNLIRIINEKPMDEVQQEPCVINTYGVTKNNGSFVRSVDLSAELTDKFATMISIGAQADGNSSAGNATAFSIYNKGLIDRVTPEKAVLTTTSQSAEEETDPFKKIWTEEFTELFQACWGDPEIDRGYFYDSGFGKDFTNETVGPLESAVAEWAQLCTGKLTQKKQYPAPFFLPFNLSLTMDGLGGMKIYNSFKIDDKILPPTYNSDAIQLIIKSLSHEISETDWTTKVETFAKPIFGITAPKTGNFNFFKSKNNNNYKGGGGGSSSDDYPVENYTLTSKYPIGNIFVKEETKKTFIMLHHTAGHSKGPKSTVTGWSKRAYSYFLEKGRIGNRIATHYVIDQKGNAEHVFPEKYWSGNVGRGFPGWMNKQSLSIEIQAIGYLTKISDGPPPVYKMYKGSKWPHRKYGGFAARPVDDNYNPITYKGYDWYEGYSNAAINATERVVTGWMSKYNIPFHYNYKRLFPNASPTFYGQSEFNSAWKGVLTHNSLKQSKSDIFPQKEMLQMLKRISTSRS